MHKWQIIHDGFSHTDNHHVASASRCIRCRTDTTFNPGAFQNSFRCKVFLISKQTPDRLGITLGMQVPVNLVWCTRRSKFLCKCQTILIQIGHDDGMRTGGPRRREGNQTDGTGATNDNTPTKM